MTETTAAAHRLASRQKWLLPLNREGLGIEAIYRRPNTSKPAPGHKIYPYLLRKLAVPDLTGFGRWT